VATGGVLSEEAAIAEIVFRTRMARDLGYGVTGPRNIWQLTPPERRVYAEGLRILDEREAERQTRMMGGDPDERPAGQPRESDEEMLAELDRDLRERERAGDGASAPGSR
jgi:hypothetical protein